LQAAQRCQPETDNSANLSGHIALVTGASSGVGRAIALALARRGVELCIVGRNSAGLSETAAIARQASNVSSFQLDLNNEITIQPLQDHLSSTGRLDILVHSAGIIHQGPMESSPIEHFDLQYATNVRAPYLLTQRLLPLLAASRGQVVFINSSAGLLVRGSEVGQYAATKHALKAVADSFREEVNPKGIRVLTIYLGRTATPMQQAACLHEGKLYKPENLLQPADVASLIVHTLMLPRTAEVTDINIRPMIKT
jgi:NAD(P)-dependent dehydrogenase (short-subunit alcohol dehydrogenase family)